MNNVNTFSISIILLFVLFNHANATSKLETEGGIEDKAQNQLAISYGPGSFYPKDPALKTIDAEEIGLEFSKRLGKRLQMTVYGNHKFGSGLKIDELLGGMIYNFSSKHHFKSSFYLGARVGVISGNAQAISHLKSNQATREYQFAHQIFLGQRFNFFKNFSWNPHGIFKYDQIKPHTSEFQFNLMSMVWTF